MTTSNLNHKNIFVQALIATLRAREHFRHNGLLTDDDDKNGNQPARRIYAMRGSTLDDAQEARIKPVLLDEFASQLKMAVLLGDPGSGKTE